MAVDLSHRLASGITIGELLERAEKWWTETARHLIPKEFTRLNNVRIKTGAGVPLLKVKEIGEDMKVGNILRGVPWAELTSRERLRIARGWHDGLLLWGQSDGRLIATDQVAPRAETEH